MSYFMGSYQHLYNTATISFRVGPLISLFLTAIACGNIKPCLAAFGGDQFDQKDVRHTLKNLMPS